MSLHERLNAGNLTITPDRMTAAATQVGNEIAKHLDQKVPA